MRNSPDLGSWQFIVAPEDGTSELTAVSLKIESVGCSLGFDRSCLTIFKDLKPLRIIVRKTVTASRVRLRVSVRVVSDVVNVVTEFNEIISLRITMKNVLMLFSSNNPENVNGVRVIRVVGVVEGEA